ncbi:hypothetical protein [Cryobacterium luteum]|uniref:Uncharacterized protein n=1 Tax=Cryobacterium luteum TaxID=1424661 RepID=A0A1H8AMG2_9MICO|nr:hypothetical protein [Cryobacterium luteum]TFB88570.1 hypothetical protein E3O10_12335 [Cryobacterium luteum]SEM71851.1 hypothetical protein SAMN05216281_101252 [Cryobacterium luteum]
MNSDKRNGWRKMGRRGIGLIGIVYLVIGVVVAANQSYLVAWNVPGNILEGMAAIVLWPFVAFFGVDLHTLIA